MSSSSDVGYFSNLSQFCFDVVISFCIRRSGILVNSRKISGLVVVITNFHWQSLWVKFMGRENIFRIQCCALHSRSCILTSSIQQCRDEDEGYFYPHIAINHSSHTHSRQLTFSVDFSFQWHYNIPNRFCNPTCFTGSVDSLAIAATHSSILFELDCPLHFSDDLVVFMGNGIFIVQARQ